MRKTLLTITIIEICFLLNINAGNGITFQIEELSKPEKLLPVKAQNDAYQMLIDSDYSMTLNSIKEKK